MDMIRERVPLRVNDRANSSGIGPSKFCEVVQVGNTAAIVTRDGAATADNLLLSSAGPINKRCSVPWALNAQLESVAQRF